MSENDKISEFDIEEMKNILPPAHTAGVSTAKSRYFEWSDIYTLISQTFDIFTPFITLAICLYISTTDTQLASDSQEHTSSLPSFSSSTPPECDRPSLDVTTWAVWVVSTHVCYVRYLVITQNSSTSSYIVYSMHTDFMAVKTGRFPS